MKLPFPQEVEKWTWETLASLQGENEGQYLEFKSTLHAPEGEQAEDWQKDLEREITAFANANGGLIIFGVRDGDAKPVLFEKPEHEIHQSVTRLIQNTTPIPDVDISEPLNPPTDDTDRIALIVKVHEAPRKPVLTSDSAIYIRINDRKEPMSREQIESLFIDRNRRQQAIRQLEMEIDRYHNIIHGSERPIRVHGASPPDFHLLNTGSLKEVLRENTHLYAKQDVREHINNIFADIRWIEDREVFVGRVLSGYQDTHYSSKEHFHKEERRELKERAERLERNLAKLASETNLDVEVSLEDS